MYRMAVLVIVLFSSRMAVAAEWELWGIATPADGDVVEINELEPVTISGWGVANSQPPGPDGAPNQPWYIVIWDADDDCADEPVAEIPFVVGEDGKWSVSYSPAHSGNYFAELSLTGVEGPPNVGDPDFMDADSWSVLFEVELSVGDPTSGDLPLPEEPAPESPGEEPNPELPEEEPYPEEPSEEPYPEDP